MKLISLAFWTLTPLVLAAGEVQTGDTLSQVQAALGTPRGQMSAQGRQLLYFDRGEIELRAGAVTRVALMSVDEHAARETRRAADAARMREEQEIRQARSITEGEALKARMLADPAFLSAAPGEQLAFWEYFARSHPEVPVAEQLAAARQRTREQAEARRAGEIREERLAELEEQLMAVETRYDAARSRRYLVHYGGHHGLRQATNLWPVEYHFTQEYARPYAATISYPAWGSTPYDQRKILRTNDSPDNDQRNRRHPARNADRGFRDWMSRQRY